MNKRGRKKPHKSKKLKKSEKSNLISSNYKKCFEYLRESKKFIWIVIGVFFFSLVLGFLFQPAEISRVILDYVEKILQETEGMSSPDMILFILLNNLRVGFMGIIYGVFLGIFPILLTFANGYVVGFISSIAISSSGAGSLLSLLPHGIFELPAIFISFAVGIKFGTFIFYEEKMNTFVKFFKESLRVFLFIIVPLLIIAAIIEGSLIYILN